MADVSTAKPPLRRQAPSPRRGEFLDAGMRCITRLGLRNCTMDDFATEAGVSRITLYREFGNREEFIDAIHVLRYRQFNVAFGKLVPRFANFAALAERYFTDSARVVKEREITQQFARQPIDYTEPGTAMHAAAFEFWGPILAKEQAAGNLPAQMDLARATQWLLVMQATVSRLGGDGNVSIEVIGELVRTFLLPAFSA